MEKYIFICDKCKKEREQRVFTTSFLHRVGKKEVCNECYDIYTQKDKELNQEYSNKLKELEENF